MLALIERIYKAAINPVKCAKEINALRFGIIGAAQIAPIALIWPARSHPEVVITAVAARDEQKARSYAKKHSIGKVYFGPTGYQQLIDDPDIDVIYIPLPNGLHFEWSSKALLAGKHVLLEKPSTDSAEETQRLFEIAKAKGLVIMEAFHYRFHPSYLRLKEIVNSGEFGKITSVKSELAVPAGFIKKDDIRFNYDLGGGSLMDMGVYPVSAVRNLIGSEPVSVITATHDAHIDPKIDRGVRATLEFPNDITAEVHSDLGIPWRMGIIPRWRHIHITVKLEGGEVSLSNFPGAWIYHTITITPKKGPKRTEKAYTLKGGKGEQWWTTYRYQLEAFVDLVRGRTPHTVMTEEDSINQMKAVEMVYSKLGLPARPLSKYVP
ncbi:hypothetical protein M422DRAFT_28689 [Sphaerobolus stellatus SS14]|uniref:D-xylose 1-dehydrogenase (NADP(+), D-xylono-1,5-lactone-forming) n=1 Tax=Sphaerobolus stellatus (strain SS14) TaxID=990650 RepID=A0A0C9VIU6_SPHS4|nr:hypothetical protein M422DRAFT_28689 [Sphaerobolus stellatus SS14]